MAAPGMVLIPVIINNLDRKGLFKSHPRLSAPLQVFKNKSIFVNKDSKQLHRQEQYREGRLETESDLTCGSKNVIFERVQTEVSPNWRKQNCILQTWLQLIESGMQIRRGSELFYCSVMYSVLFLG